MIYSRDDTTLPSTKQVKKNQLIDHEFGAVTCLRSPNSRMVRLRVTEQGTVRASLPKRAPLYLVTELLEASREDIRRLIAQQQSKRPVYSSGMSIGSTHKLSLIFADVEFPKRKYVGQHIEITLPSSTQLQSLETQNYISTQIKRALKREAMAYLPRRLTHLANIYGFTYERERFGNQTGRWGSCSSSGTISLNVALMNLPLEIIDYVLIHELAHTKQMNHSIEFWKIVEDCMPEYREHRKILKSMSPIC